LIEKNLLKILLQLRGVICVWQKGLTSWPPSISALESFKERWPAQPRHGYYLDLFKKNNLSLVRKFRKYISLIKKWEQVKTALIKGNLKLLQALSKNADLKPV